MFKYCTESSIIICRLYHFGFSFKILTLNKYKNYKHIQVQLKKFEYGEKVFFFFFYLF